MTKQYCDACGKETDYDVWHIQLKFWNCTRDIALCMKHGARAANFLGFCYDGGNILSIARGEYVTGEGPIPVLIDKPDALIAGGMVRDDE